jgi:DNA-binding beta-propeller fold protein YncE
MNRVCALCLLALCAAACVSVSAQQPPQATELPSSPFFIKNTWIIGGAGSWDYLTMDADTGRLFIAHGAQVQVVDVKTGTLAGQITGLHEAHAIALDSSGEFGYISDGLVDQVKIFDRRSLQIVATIATGPGPRALVLDAQSGLLFAICTNPIVATQQQSPAGQPQRPAGANPRSAQRNPTPQPGANREIKTSISVIDVAARRRMGQILMPGKLGFAQSDGNGQVFVLLVDRNQVARLDASAIAGLLHVRSDGAASTPPPIAEPGPTGPGSAESGQAAQEAAPTVLDWSHETSPSESAQASMRIFPLGSDCREPRSLAVDGAHQRLFAACSNMKLTVLNSGTGEVVTSLPIGPGADAVGFDPGRGLIYTANGDAQGTLTIIHQDVTDTYAEIQNLATRRRARTMAVNTDTGQVYLVTDYMGVDLAHQGGIGSLKSTPVAGSFQVLVIGH